MNFLYLSSTMQAYDYYIVAYQTNISRDTNIFCRPYPPQKERERGTVRVRFFSHTASRSHFIYVLWKNCWLQVCVCKVHIQVCTSGNKKLQGPESKPAKQLRPFNLVEICQNTASFVMKYCIVLSQ